jgi:hypothetical protein
MHLTQMADMTVCVVFRNDPYHRRLIPEHQDGTLPDGEHRLELVTFTGISRAEHCEMIGDSRRADAAMPQEQDDPEQDDDADTIELIR